MLLLKHQVLAITTFILFIAIIEDEVGRGIYLFGFVVPLLCFSNGEKNPMVVGANRRLTGSSLERKYRMERYNL